MQVLTVYFIVFVIENVRLVRNEKIDPRYVLDSTNFKNAVAKELLKKKLLNLETARQQDSLVQFLKNGGKNPSTLKGKSNFYTDDDPSRKQAQMANSFIASSNLLFGTKSQRKTTNNTGKSTNKEGILDMQSLRHSYSGYNEDGNDLLVSKDVFSAVGRKMAKSKRGSQDPISCYLTNPKKITCMHKDIIYKIQLPSGEVADDEIGRIVESIYRAVEVNGATGRLTSDESTKKKRASEDYMKSLLLSNLLLGANPKAAMLPPYNGNAVYIPLIIPVGQEVKAPKPQLPYYSGLLVDPKMQLPYNLSGSGLNNPLSKLFDAYGQYIFPENYLVQESNVKQRSDNATEEKRRNWLALMATNGYVPPERSMNSRIAGEVESLKERDEGRAASKEDKMSIAENGDNSNEILGKRHSRDTYALRHQIRRKGDSEKFYGEESPTFSEKLKEEKQQLLSRPVFTKYLTRANSNPCACSTKPSACCPTTCKTTCATRCTTKCTTKCTTCTTKRCCPTLCSTCPTTCPVILQCPHCPHWLDSPSSMGLPECSNQRNGNEPFRYVPAKISSNGVVARYSSHKLADGIDGQKSAYYIAETLEQRSNLVDPQLLASKNKAIQNRTKVGDSNAKQSFFAKLRRKFHKEKSGEEGGNVRSVGNVRKRIISQTKVGGGRYVVQYHQPNDFNVQTIPTWTLTSSPVKMFQKPTNLTNQGVQTTTGTQQQHQPQPAAPVYIPQPIGPVGVPTAQTQTTAHPSTQSTIHPTSHLSFTHSTQHVYQLQQVASQSIPPGPPNQPLDPYLQPPAAAPQPPSMQPQPPVGQTQIPAGPLQPPAEQAQLPFGQPQPPAGYPIPPNGQIQPIPPCQTQVPPQQPQPLVGQTQPPAGHPQMPSSQSASPNQQASLPVPEIPPVQPGAPSQVGPPPAPGMPYQSGASSSTQMGSSSTATTVRTTLPSNTTQRMAQCVTGSPTTTITGNNQSFNNSGQKLVQSTAHTAPHTNSQKQPTASAKDRDQVWEDQKVERQYQGTADQFKQELSRTNQAPILNVAMKNPNRLYGPSPLAYQIKSPIQHDIPPPYWNEYRGRESGMRDAAYDFNPGENNEDPRPYRREQQQQQANDWDEEPDPYRSETSWYPRPKKSIYQRIARVKQYMHKREPTRRSN